MSRNGCLGNLRPDREWGVVRILSASLAGFLLIFAIWVGFQ